MQGIETSRRVGFVMIALAVLLASFVIAAPQASANHAPSDTCDTGQDDSSYSAFTFYYDTNGDGTPDGVVSGTNQLGTTNEYCDNGKYKKNETYLPALGGQVHVSCSEIFNSNPPGYATNGRHPIQGSGDPRIISYKIQKYDGTRLVQTCGETFEDASITVVKNTTPQTSAEFGFSLTGTIPPTPSSSGGSFSDSANVAGNGGSTTWSALSAGSYNLAEVGQAAGYEFASVSCTSNGYGSTFGYTGPAASINLVGGTDVTCTYTNVKDAPEAKPVVVRIVQGSCDYRDGVSWTNTTFSFRLDGVSTEGKVEMTVTGPLDNTSVPSATYVMSQKKEIELASGTYKWEAKSIETGYELVGPSEGEFTLPECGPDEPKTVTVMVDLGACVWDGDSSLNGVTASIIPDGAATILVTNVDEGTEFDLFMHAQTVTVGPGDYTWTATATGNYEFEGDDDGAFTADACAPPSSLGDTVWHDVDADGLQGADEPGVPDIKVSLEVDGVTVATDMTDENGKYLFEDLEPGVEYTIVFTIPDVWTITTQDAGDDALDSDAAPDGSTVPVVLAPGESNLTVDAGVVSNIGTIVVTKTTDTDTDQEFGFTVGDNTVELGSGESVEFDLVSGSYTITEVVVDGWDLVSILCSGDSEPVGETGVSLFVPPGETVGCTFVNSELDAPLGVIGDYVWHDADSDGTQDANEPGVGSVTVDLIEVASGDVIASTVTDSSGVYVFVNVPEGTYIVEFTIPDTWAFTTPDVGPDDAVDSDVVGATGPVGQTEDVVLGAGEVNTTVDAGIYLIEVLPETPVTPTTPTTPTPNTPVTPTPNTPVTPTPTTPATPTATTDVDDTKVLGIQTELPATGMDDWRAGLLALALVMAGAGILLVARKEDDGLGVVGLN